MSGAIHTIENEKFLKHGVHECWTRTDLLSVWTLIQGPVTSREPGEPLTCPVSFPAFGFKLAESPLGSDRSR